MSLFTIAISGITGFTRMGRPFLNTKIGSMECKMLYDTGADISCMSEKDFRRIPAEVRPEKIPTTAIGKYRSASGGDLEVKGIYMLPVQLLGKTVKHPFCVVRQLSESAILGVDFIHKHRLSYCPEFQQFGWTENSKWRRGVATASAALTLPAFSVCNIRVNLFSEEGGKIIKPDPIMI
jgi:hypothetical protein